MLAFWPIIRAGNLAATLWEGECLAFASENRSLRGNALTLTISLWEMGYLLLEG